tara:strand:- start:28065 stop:28250 length:186 start_codon:yes stop_codon:yes gene_type:complete
MKKEAKPASTAAVTHRRKIRAIFKPLARFPVTFPKQLVQAAREFTDRNRKAIGRNRIEILE